MKKKGLLFWRDAKYMQRVCLSVLALGAFLMFGINAVMPVQAQGTVPEDGQLMTAQQEVEMKAEASESAETLHTYGAGESVFVIDEPVDGWYQVRYQSQTGYVPTTNLVVAEMDMAALDAEFAAREQEGQVMVEEVERYRDEAKRSKIWGTVIVVLVIAIFATGIISTMKIGKRVEEKA